MIWCRPMFHEISYRCLMTGSLYQLVCILYQLDSYKRDNILLEAFKEESRRGFTDLLHTSHGTDDTHTFHFIADRITLYARCI